MELGYHRFALNQDDNQNSSENSDDSPPSPQLYDTKATSTSSPKKRRGTHKRVVYVPIKEVEGTRLKGETNAPPPDSWAWRKYGQKPIKGSPYPRGYYRCSSSKGCPARKQVERSRTDPTMVMVTYSCEHNHSWPASRNNNNHHHNALSSPPTSPTTTNEATHSNNDDHLEEEEEEAPNVITRRIGPEPEPEPEPEPDLRFTSLEVGPFSTTTDQYGWFSDLDSTSSTMLESPLMARDMVEDNDMATIFSIRDDEESFFADLGELPECSTVFRRKEIEYHHNLASWCGTT
ncbi:probable WRKY transcription factor 65 isoform X2 [Rutidosis leptorrhynchoides]|uniref:probable WRKY transcription factor 65 isoform X2 n=1 Tax=Rutidosis leptorrhynchoides TaxID=125765 RepID=UPI003A990E47